MSRQIVIVDDQFRLRRALQRLHAPPIIMPTSVKEKTEKVFGQLVELAQVQGPPSRQQRRRKAFTTAFASVKHLGLPRHKRRGMAWAQVSKPHLSSAD